MIAPIQTSYSGYKFRSRLEARWAVFFDAMGLQWVYEPEGFVLPSGVHYLPDFLVTSPTGLKQWYEIKPEGVTTDPKFEAFKRALSDKPDHAELLSGDPLAWAAPHVDAKRKTPRAGGVCPRCGGLFNKFGYGPVYDFGDEFAILCEPCDHDTPDGGGHQIEKGALVPCRPYKGSVLVSYAYWALALRKVEQAAIKARSARFEHGESPDA